MSAKRNLVWLFARNTEWGRKQLGQETLFEQEARRRLRAIGLLALQKVREDDSRWRSDGTRGRDLQYVDGDVRVSVTNGYSRDHDCYTTDIILAPRDGSGRRLHIVYDERGNEIVNEWPCSETG